MLIRLREAQRTVMFYEGARFHEERYKQYGDRLADMGNLVRDGLQIPVDRYDEARRNIAECKRRMAELFKATPVILTPAANGARPAGTHVDRRFTTGFTMHCLGDTGHQDSDAGRIGLAAWSPTDRGPRSGCAGHSDCGEVGTTAQQSGECFGLEVR
jgi:hypothetical protein